MTRLGDDAPSRNTGILVMYLSDRKDIMRTYFYKIKFLRFVCVKKSVPFLDRSVFQVRSFINFGSGERSSSTILAILGETLWNCRRNFRYFW